MSDDPAGPHRPGPGAEATDLDPTTPRHDAPSTTPEVRPPDPSEATTREDPAGVPLPRGRGPDDGAEDFGPGSSVGDFEVVGRLGQGSLARVFLARQVSLGRLVALKVSASRGHEPRALAQLDHEHIVRVYSVTESAEGRLLCMQYVPGISLDWLLAEVRRLDRASWSGRAILDAIDRRGPHPAALDPAALRDRERLGRADWVEAACWLGARLAEALAYAHARGVLHRDVKPANILLNPYGRPLLADFNLATDPGSGPSDGGLFGGTLAYMAPEHLDAFNPSEPTTPEAVDGRSDLYALGVVLFEMLGGARPFASESRAEGSGLTTLRDLAAERRVGVPPAALIARDPGLPRALAMAVARCLEPDPARRYGSPADLARALEGCRAIRRIGRGLPDGRLSRRVDRNPWAAVAVAAFLPQVLASTINIAYNATQIVDHLSASQQRLFPLLVLAYNAAAYPACAAVAFAIIAPVYRTWRAIRDGLRPAEGEEAAARRLVLAWPRWLVGLVAAGWMPGGLIFPAALSAWPGAGGPLDPEAFGHFAASFWLSGLVALTYSYFGVRYVSLRAIYPGLWADARDLPAAFARELAGAGRNLSAFQALSALVPLAGAALLLGFGPDELSRPTRLLAGGLIALGMAGIGLGIAIAGLVGRTLAAMRGDDPTRDDAAPPARCPAGPSPGVT